MREDTSIDFDDGECCVYLHRKPKAGGIFYVGMGTWDRAYSKRIRNQDWKKVVDQHPNYEVVIFRSGLSIDEAVKIEKECIEYLGLMNLTNRISGGNKGYYGKRHSEQSKELMRKARAGRTYSDAHREQMRQSALRQHYDPNLYRFEKDGAIIDVTRKVFIALTGANKHCVWALIKGRQKTCLGWRIVNG